MEKGIHYTVERHLSAENVKDILTTAIEGGIGYWACLDNDTPEWNEARETCRARKPEEGPYYCDMAYELLAHGKSIRLTDADADQDHLKKDEIWDLTWEKLRAGSRIWEDETGRNLPKTIEDGDFDAEYADMLIQYALFGEIVYG